MLIDGPTRSSLLRRALTALAIGAASLIAAGAAQAYDAAPGWVASDYVTGFDHAGEAGPVGLAFDGSGNLLVAATASASLHKVPPGGGTAAGTKIKDGYGSAGGLAFDKSGRLYMARGNQGDVVELNPASGDVIRTVVSGLPCPVGLATDPISGDLFVSNVFCPGGGIFRVSGFAGGPGTAKRYAGLQDADGLTFAPDGTLYAAGGDEIVRIGGTSSSSPGATSSFADLPNGDGIAYSPATAQSGEYLVVVRTDGEIDRVDFDGTVTPIVTGASRGDLVTVGPDRCVYADLQDRVIKLGPSTGTCGFATPLDGQNVLGERTSAQRVVDTAIKAKAPKTVRRGKTFVLTMKVSNRSSRTAHTVVVTDTLPKGVTFAKARASAGGKCKRRGRTISCRRKTLAARKSFTVMLRVRSMRGSAYTNSAKVKSNDLDPAPGNNKSKSKTKVKRSR
ncbi:MAG TPA: hypothetical protein VH247_06990 [Thermoleophilaceae bacterium]|nr:hypothetical protein [Thermoleophilaceae bacterium]